MRNMLIRHRERYLINPQGEIVCMYIYIYEDLLTQQLSFTAELK